MIIADLCRVIKHSRNKSYCIYTQQDLIYLGILKNVCSIESMRQMNEKLNEEICIEPLSFLSGDAYLNELPDSTALNNYLERLSPPVYQTCGGRWLAA